MRIGVCSLTESDHTWITGCCDDGCPVYIRFTPVNGYVLFNAVQTEPTAPRKVKDKVPRDLETICLKALAKKPEERYADCSQLTDDLRRWQEGEPIRARPLGPLERAGRWVRRNPALAGMTAAVILASL